MKWTRTWLALALVGYTCQASAECHVHAPDDYPNFGNRPLVIPVTGDRAACQALNRERFGGRGRCHCFDDVPLGADSPMRLDFTGNPATPEEVPLP